MIFHVIIKVCFALISVLSSVLGFVRLRSIPDLNDTLKKNIRLLDFYSCVGGLCDMIMFFILLCLIPEGIYGTGIEFVAVLVIVLVYLPLCIYWNVKLNRRMRDAYPHFKSQYRQKGLKKYVGKYYTGLMTTCITKAFFWFVFVIYVVET